MGDLVARGPDSHAVLALVEELDAIAVRGNHEEKVLACRRGDRAPDEHRRLADTLSKHEWSLLEGMPLWLDLPEHGLRVVHAGVVPGQSIERMPPEALLTMRALDGRGRWTDKKDARPLWGERYVGPPHVVFGHNALPAPQLHVWATGIDTGCVYGNRLTALVLGGREPMPRGHAARAKLASVPARHRYHSDRR